MIINLEIEIFFLLERDIRIEAFNLNVLEKTEHNQVC